MQIQCPECKYDFEVKPQQLRTYQFWCNDCESGGQTITMVESGQKIQVGCNLCKKPMEVIFDKLETVTVIK